MVSPWFPIRPRCCHFLSPVPRLYDFQMCLLPKDRATIGCSFRYLSKQFVRGASWCDTLRDLVRTSHFEESSARAISSSTKIPLRFVEDMVSLQSNSTAENRARFYDKQYDYDNSWKSSWSNSRKICCLENCQRLCQSIVSKKYIYGGHHHLGHRRQDHQIIFSKIIIMTSSKHSYRHAWLCRILSHVTYICFI